MEITKYFDQVKEDYEIYGQNDGEWEYFEKEIEYSAFLIRRKKQQLYITYFFENENYKRIKRKESSNCKN